MPARDEQIDTMCSLIPADAHETFTVVDLGAGEGILAQAVLERFPHCRYVALDGSMGRHPGEGGGLSVSAESAGATEVGLFARRNPPHRQESPRWSVHTTEYTEYMDA